MARTDNTQVAAWHYVTTEFFRNGGRVVLGPFATREGAFNARRYVERLEGHERYCIDTTGGGG